MGWKSQRNSRFRRWRVPQHDLRRSWSRLGSGDSPTRHSIWSVWNPPSHVKWPPWNKSKKLSHYLINSIGKLPISTQILPKIKLLKTILNMFHNKVISSTCVFIAQKKFIHFFSNNKNVSDNENAICKSLCRLHMFKNISFSYICFHVCYKHSKQWISNGLTCWLFWTIKFHTTHRLLKSTGERSGAKAQWNISSVVIVLFYSWSLKTLSIRNCLR